MKTNMHNVFEILMKIVFFICSCISIVAVLFICGFIFVNGVPAIQEIGPLKFLFGTSWKPNQDIYGIFPMIIASIYVTGLSIAIGVPIGILSAVFFADYCPKKLYGILWPAVELLAGIPSIVYGFFGLVVIVPIVQTIIGTSGKNMLTASVLLGIMILPTIISTAYTSLKAVPSNYYEGALALGATKEKSIFRVVLPAAKSGVFAGIILGIGRSIGETMAVVMIAGNQAIMPGSIFSGVRTMTSNIVLEMAYAQGLHRDALIATAVVLFVFILIINLSLSLIKKDANK